MIAIHRPSAAQFRSVARKGITGRTRDPAPPVVIDQALGGSQIFCNFGEVALALRRPLDGGEAARIVVPASLLEEIESSRQGVVTIEPGDTVCRATWEQSGSPQESKWPTIDHAALEMPLLPKTFKSNDRTILQALFECGKTTLRDSVKFAMKRLQIQGKSGQLAGTDGRQLLMWNGFNVPFSDTLLLPALPIFGHRELGMANDVRIGKTSSHVVLTAGPWTIWLLIDNEGRFPKVESVVPRDAVHVLRLDEDDRLKAAEFCMHAVKVEDEPVSITVELGPTRALRRKTGSGSPPEELSFHHSRSEGEPVTFVLNRDHLLRALSLGFREISTPSDNGPVVFQDQHRTSVVTALVPSQAIPAIRAPANTALARRKQTIPISEGVHSMASEPNGRGHPPETSDAESLDFMAEAEGLRDSLFDVARRANRLVAMLKQLQKQRRVFETIASRYLSRNG